jgi:ribosome-associated translation inhibitor RaiA
MAKFELKFIDVINPDFKLQINQSVYDTNDNFDVKVIDIVIHEKGKDEFESITFSMDLSTAIKVAKTLRTEINKFKEREVTNV